MHFLQLLLLLQLIILLLLHLLLHREVVLVDDFSDQGAVGKGLEQELSVVGGGLVRLHRNSRR